MSAIERRNFSYYAIKGFLSAFGVGPAGKYDTKPNSAINDNFCNYKFYCPTFTVIKSSGRFIKVS